MFTWTKCQTFTFAYVKKLKILGHGQITLFERWNSELLPDSKLRSQLRKLFELG